MKNMVTPVLLMAPFHNPCFKLELAKLKYTFIYKRQPLAECYINMVCNY